MSSFAVRLSSTAALVLAAGLLAGAGAPQESSSSGTQATTPLARVASPEATAPDENVRSEPRILAAVAPPTAAVVTPPGLFSYLYVSGTALRPRQGATTQASATNTGCVYATAGSDLLMNTELHLPEGSTLKYLRLYYNDTDATFNSRGWITRYNGTTWEDLVYVVSTGSPGAGSVLSSELTHPVDNTAWGYTLIGGPNGLGSTAQVCGLRVAYYAPSQGQFTPITPCRLIDTRAPVFPAPLGGGWLPAATVRSYTIAGVCGLPAGVTAVSLNATVTGPAGPGFLALYPEGGTFPPVSTLNFLGGDTIVNAAVVPLSATGGISMALGVSGGHVILDVNGYYY